MTLIFDYWLCRFQPNDSSQYYYKSSELARSHSVSTQTHFTFFVVSHFFVPTLLLIFRACFWSVSKSHSKLNLFPFLISFVFFLLSVSNRCPKVLIFFKLPLICGFSYLQLTFAVVGCGTLSLSPFLILTDREWLEELFWRVFGRQEDVAEGIWVWAVEGFISYKLGEDWLLCSYSTEAY